MPNPTNTAGHGASDRNCANCSAAGIVRMLTSKQLTSGQVANGAPDDRPDAQAVGGIDGQLRLIDAVVQNETQRRGVWFGSGDSEQGYRLTLNWMRARPASTAFAVYASGPIVSEGIARVGRRREGIRLAGGLDLNAGTAAAANTVDRGLNRSHFLTAYYDGQTLTFRDFQTDTNGGRGVTEGDVPFLGIRTLVPLVTAAQPGSFTDKTRFVVVAYSPGIRRHGGIVIGQHRR